jgi:shikimate kinase
MLNASDNSVIAEPGGKFFLIGFMGSGKTYWGKKWALQNGMAFYDLDEEIERKEGKTIALIFEQEGEAYFRKIETKTLHAFTAIENCIIACGGGTACFNHNLDWMNTNGKTVYISAGPQYIFNRISEEKDKRPLIKKFNEAELLFFIEQKLKEREPFYKQAKLILPVDELDENSLSA